MPRAQQPPATEGPLPFHRLYRGLAGFKAWRPIVAVIVAAAVYIVLGVVFFGALVAIGLVTGIVDLGDTAAEANDNLYKLAEIDAASPFSLILALGSVVLMLPSAIIGQLAAGLRPLGVRHSVTFRIRWRWFAVSMVPAFAIVGVGFVLPIVFALLAGEQPFGPFTTDPVLFVLCAVLILVITPFQAAAEEYVFRGLLLQAIGSWLRFAWVGWVITTLLFVSGHIYDPWGLASVGAFGLGAAIVATRTGGIEAGVALHSVNNITGFLVLAAGVQGFTVNPTSVSSDLGTNILSLALTLITTAAWVFWVDRLARRRGVERLGALPVQDSVSSPGVLDPHA